MHVLFLNPQGNFDPNDSYWMEHPDFGGQLVYVKEVALAMERQGHTVDIVTRRFDDPDWPEFSDEIDGYPGHEGVRIVRIPCGPNDRFLPKEELWPYLGTDWLDGILDFYERDAHEPEAVTTHYADGGLTGALLEERTGTPFTFTGHSLGAQKMDRLGVDRDNLEEMDERFRFARRLMAERVAMNRAARVITSTQQERLEQYSHRAYQGALDVSDERKFAVVPPGVNRRLFHEAPSETDPEIRARIQQALQRDVSPERRELPLVLCSSRLDRKKNILGLVRAFVASETLQRTANLAVVARGTDNALREREQYEGESRAILDEMAQLLDEHGLWHAVTSFPLDNQAELAAAYRAASERHSVFALTALYEPFGLAPLEAMSCGLPAVVTQNGGPSESMVEGDRRFGELVDPEDPPAIAEGLLAVLASEATWMSYRDAGIERVIGRYTWERTAESYLSVLHDIRTEPAVPSSDRRAIPDYFTDPGPETDISREQLAEIYLTNP
ncbi:MAG: glycosyltransferase [Candidatus Bipolaricaulia bacterium]